jgi:putative ubiquitin-RnfH superfamily antitoxin RatB of RatAB toxin-antitoxin module
MAPSEIGSDSALIAVEVCYARPGRQVLIGLAVARSTPVEQAIRHSGVLAHFPEIDLKENKVGIFSRLCELDHLLFDGDRIEIYRPLCAAPQDLRRNRASAQGAR